MTGAKTWIHLSNGHTEPLKLPGAVNMALDSHLLARSIGTRDTSYLVRFYGWSNTCLSIGANQSLSPTALERCNSAGVEVVRRSTGGGAVLHGHDFTYAVVGPNEGRGVAEIYRFVAEALVSGLHQVGIEATVVEHIGSLRATACFAAPTGADLAVDGRKICGSAQVRRSGWFLQHGSIPLEDRRDLTAQLTDSKEQDDSGWLSMFRPGICLSDVAAALLEGFDKAWGESAGKSRPAAVTHDSC